MQKKSFYLACVLALGLVGCSSAPPALDHNSGFLPNYGSLKPVPSPEGSQIYTYTAPDVNRSDYHALIVDPVILYQNATSGGVTNQQIATTRTKLSNGVKQVAAQHIALTQTPGPGVARLRVAITGATAADEGFKPWNVVPISAAIKLATMATDTDSKTPVLVIELEFTDSVTGKLLREDVTVISGETFRSRANTPEEFQKLAQAWVKKALEYTANSPTPSK